MAESTFNSLDEVRAEMDAIGQLFDDTNFIRELESSITDFEYQGLNVLASEGRKESTLQSRVILSKERTNRFFILVFRDSSESRINFRLRIVYECRMKAA